ncbi:secretory carrier-associated membrane protein 1-like isoform X3 [Centruroides sculpturatus]|uniref:secretory carrier-associated membrane protein 1-like isoform X3 n=1 Tax=Centruroides sculpturatus TaxID=218467 RepID=UPI000C6D91F6|nr:secretory carrier-associated membrane protein 1-like isoform X3 [Centruroides sculpturatus]
MSGFDSNPFADPYASNPFADPTVQQVTNQANRAQSALDDYNPFADQQQKTVQQAPGTNPPQYQPPPIKQDTPQPAVMQPISEPPPAYTPTGAQNFSTADLQKKQEELERKAAELQAREEALRKVPYNVRANNWPPLPEKCCVGPCFYQDIGVDIPLEFQKIVRSIYYLWIFYVGVLLLNVLGTMAILFVDGDATTFGFSLLAIFLFTPLSFVCWFRPLYKAFRSDSSFNFMVFFFVFFFQFILAVIYAIGFPKVGSCGYIISIELLKTNAAVATLSFIISGLHTIFAVISLLMLLKVHRLYRSTGASFAKAQQEFTSGVLRNEHVQQAAATAVSGATQQAMNQAVSGNRY